jgi:hypothetical protein
MLLKGSLAEIDGRENLKNPPVEQSQNAVCLLNLWASFPTDWDSMFEIDQQTGRFVTL